MFAISQSGPKFITLVSCIISQKYMQKNSVCPLKSKLSNLTTIKCVKTYNISFPLYS